MKDKLSRRLRLEPDAVIQEFGASLAADTFANLARAFSDPPERELRELITAAKACAVAREDLTDEERRSIGDDLAQFELEIDAIAIGKTERWTAYAAIEHAFFIALAAPPSDEFVTKARAARLSARNAGLKSGEKRRKDGEPIKEMIKQIRRERPHFSQERIADEVSVRVSNMAKNRRPGVPIASRRRLVKIVSEMERSGEIPSRTRSGRVLTGS